MENGCNSALVTQRQQPSRRRAPRAMKACRACATSKTKCDNLVKCMRCLKKAIQCSRDVDIDLSEHDELRGLTHISETMTSNLLDKMISPDGGAQNESYCRPDAMLLDSHTAQKETGMLRWHFYVTKNIFGSSLTRLIPQIFPVFLHH
jgi:hypothetical protein